MHQITVAPGITRVLLNPESTETFTPVVFRDEGSDYLQLAACTFSPRPVWRLTGQGESGEVKQTANGEVVSFDSGERVQAGTAYSAVLRFTYPGAPVLTGLGAHEDGIFDYAGRSELLYEHNMNEDPDPLPAEQRRLGHPDRGRMRHAVPGRAERVHL